MKRQEREKERIEWREYDRYMEESFDSIIALFNYINEDLHCRSDYYKYIGKNFVNDDLICYLLMLVYHTPLEQLNSVRIEPMKRENIKNMERMLEKDFELKQFIKREKEWRKSE